MGTPHDAHRRRRPARHHGHPAGPGGGIRPLFGAGDLYDAKPDYKTAALCKQVRRILALTLAGECGDPLLQSLIVEEVLPAPHAGRLLARVLLRAPQEGAAPSILEVHERLAKVEGLLRMRVGEAIARKRTPELAFDIIPVGPRPGPAPEEAGHE
jgi:ribosome-binding factor A